MSKTELQRDREIIDAATPPGDGWGDHLELVDNMVGGWFTRSPVVEAEAQADKDADFIARARTRWPALVEVEEKRLKLCEDLPIVLHCAAGPDERERVLRRNWNAEAQGRVEALNKLDGALAEIERLKSLHEEDSHLAAGELLINVPEPGTDASRLLMASKLFQGERDEAQQRVKELEAELEEKQARANRCTDLEGVITAHMLEWEDQFGSPQELQRSFKTMWDAVSDGACQGVTVEKLEKTK